MRISADTSPEVSDAVALAFLRGRFRPCDNGTSTTSSSSSMTLVEGIFFPLFSESPFSAWSIPGVFERDLLLVSIWSPSAMIESSV